MKIHQRNAGHMTKMADMPSSGKNALKIFCPGTNGLILMKLCMKHQRLKPFIFCLNYDPELTLTYFMERSNFATQVFIWKNMTMMDSLNIIASCDLESGKYCKLNEFIED